MTSRRVIPYLAATIAVLMATLLRLVLNPAAGSSIPFVTYFAAVLLLAWHSGFGPAAFAIVISVIAGGHYILAAGTDHFLPVTSAGRAAMMGFVVASGSVSFLIDLQQRTLQRAKSAEDEQRRVNEELARLNRDLEAFVYSASHDLREPLRTISLSTDVVEASLGTKLQGDGARFLGFIRTSTSRMTALLDGLLMYSKAGQIEQGPVPVVDSEQLLAEVLISLHGAILEAGATVSAARLPSVAVQESHLAQIFQNLISNAIKYGGKNITISADQQDRRVVFSVTDDGIGVPPQYAEKIFGLFKRLDRRDDDKGSGVGLAICRRVMERYGGRVWLNHPQPGEGATFCFSIPTPGSREPEEYLNGRGV